VENADNYRFNTVEVPTTIAKYMYGGNTDNYIAKHGGNTDNYIAKHCGNTDNYRKTRYRQLSQKHGRNTDNYR